MKHLKLCVVNLNKIDIDIEIDNLFDFIILENIFDYRIDYKTIISKYKKALKKDGIIMFINDITLKPNVDIFQNLFYYLYLYTGINLQSVYIDDMFEKLRESELRIIDNYRIRSMSNFFRYKNTFLVSCRIIE